MDPAAVIALMNEVSDSVASMNSGDNDSMASFSWECRQLLEQLNERLEDSYSKQVVSERKRKMVFLGLIYKRYNCSKFQILIFFLISDCCLFCLETLVCFLKPIKKVSLQKKL